MLTAFFYLLYWDLPTVLCSRYAVDIHWKSLKNMLLPENKRNFSLWENSINVDKQWLILQYKWCTSAGLVIVFCCSRTPQCYMYMYHINYRAPGVLNWFTVGPCFPHSLEFSNKTLFCFTVKPVSYFREKSLVLLVLTVISEFCQKEIKARKKKWGMLFNQLYISLFPH